MEGSTLTTTTLTPYVIDASVAMKWFSHVNEENIDDALKLQKLHLKRKCLLIAPDLLVYEIVNALRYNPNLKENDIQLALSSLLKMDIELVKPDQVLIKEAVKLACAKDITIYDSCYIALALNRGCLLITAARKLFGKVRDLPQVALLKNL